MCNEKSLLGSYSNDSLFAMLAVDTSVVSTQQKVLLFLNVKAASLERSSVSKSLGELSDLAGINVEISGLSPDTVSSTRIESGLVKTTADQSIDISYGKELEIG